MKSRKFALLGLGVLFLSFVASAGHAELGRIQTKRERMALESSSRSAQTTSLNRPAYQNIHESFLREEYSKADILADQYLLQNPGAPDANDVLYLQTLSLLKLNRPDEARQKLRQLESFASNRELKATASASIGDSYYYEGNHSRAYESYKETMKKYPVSDQKDYLRDRLLELSSEFGYTTVQNPPKNFSITNRLQQVSFDEAVFYSVQVGSFSSSKNAQALVGKLASRGYDAYVANDRSHGMNRVRVGRFSSKQEAAQAQTRLNREGYPTKIVP